MKQISNAISEQLATDMYSFGMDIIHGNNMDDPDSKVNVWTNHQWGSDLVQDSSTMICFFLPDRYLSRLSEELTELGLYDSERDDPVRANMYLWTHDSYIPLHKDTDERTTFTIYLNREWDFQEGGLFQYFNEEKDLWEVVIPQYRSMMLNTTGVPHATTPVKSPRQPRITIQGFIYTKEQTKAWENKYAKE